MLGALAVALPATAQEREYAVGQVWAYETAPGDEGSVAIIREIGQIGPEYDPMTVYHISLLGVRVPWLEESTEVQHLPVSRETLDNSVTRQTTTSARLPDYLEGKALWERDNGGVFTITLAEIAAVIRESVVPPPSNHDNKSGA